MPWIWSDQLATHPTVQVSQKVRDAWTQRPVAVWDADLDNLADVATALASEDDEPPPLSGSYSLAVAA
jgi:hypothetical protein